mgnify:CR=1 FL=1
MPTYIYKCEDCEKKFEVSGTYEFLQSYVPICPTCWKENVTKVLNDSLPAIIFKGKGFTKSVQEKK